LALATTLAAACYGAANTVEKFVENYRRAPGFVADLKDSFQRTQQTVRHLRQLLRGMSGLEDLRRTLLAFDERLQVYLEELEKFSASQDSEIAGFVHLERVRVVWRRQFLNRMRQEFLDRRGDLQFHILTALPLFVLTPPK